MRHHGSQQYIKYIHLVYSVRWQQQTEWRRIGIDLAKTFEQQRPEEDIIIMLWEEGD